MYIVKVSNVLTFSYIVYTLKQVVLICYGKKLLLVTKM